MPNINLVAEDVSKENSSPILGKGLISSIVILIFVFILYGGLLIANRALSSKIEVTKAEYDIEYNKFLSGKGNDIIDFKNRSDEAGKIIAENKLSADILNQIEKSILPSVYLDSLKYDKNTKKISLSCVGDNFQIVAKQILSFKQNEYFSTVIPSQGSLNAIEKNKVDFSIDLIIK